MNRNPEWLAAASLLSEDSGLLFAPRLNLDIDIHQGDGRRGDTGNSGSLRQSPWSDLTKFFPHFAGKAAHRMVVKPFRNGTLLRFFQAVNGALLLQKITFVLDLGFDRFELVAHRRRQRIRPRFRLNLAIEKLRGHRAQRWNQIFNPHLGTLEQLGQGLSHESAPDRMLGWLAGCPIAITRSR